MNTYRDLLNKEERFSQQAILMTERKRDWSHEDFEKFSKLLSTIMDIRTQLKASPFFHPKASAFIH